MITWTPELRSAIVSLAAMPASAVIGRESLVRDIAQRASEMTRLSPGSQLSAIQMDYVNMLRSRLGDYWVAQTLQAKAFSEAFAAACQ